jgi:hypothetical protein
MGTSKSNEQIADRGEKRIEASLTMQQKRRHQDAGRKRNKERLKRLEGDW